MKYVERTLEANPGIENADLFAGAREIDPSVGQLSARQLENTLNRGLVRPYVDLNYGPQEKYPRLTLPVREPEDTAGLTAALEKMVPLGLRVEASVVRAKLNLPDPPPDAELLAAPGSAVPNNRPDKAAEVRKWSLPRAP